MRISVVIPAYNEEKQLPKCLESLCRQETERSFEVIVVDNNSTDNTVGAAETFANRLNIRVIQEVKQGRGAARKCGWEAATGDVIFSTDADTMLPPDWIESFARILEEHPEYIGVYGSVRIDDCGAVRNRAFNVFHPMFLRSYRLFCRHHLLPGFSFALRKDAYEKTEGFDPDNNGQEDIDLSRKVKHIGRIHYDRSTPVVFSGRRFQDGLLKGMLEYTYVFFQVSVRGKKDIELSDHR